MTIVGRWFQRCRGALLVATAAWIAASIVAAGGAAAGDDDDDVPPPPRVLPPSVGVPREQVVDLSVTVAPDLPCVWPRGMTALEVTPGATFGRTGRNRVRVVMDEHTGTHLDAPAHFIPPPGSGLPEAGPMGLVTNEKVPAWQLCGEACVIDVRAGRDDVPPGSGRVIGPEVVRAWEEAERPLGPGDVVFFRSDWTRDHYRPFPEGKRFVEAALAGEAPAWPAPAPETIEYLASRGVTTLGLDGPSMGPLPDGAAATHRAGFRHGMVWVECVDHLDRLPTRGALVAILPAKHAGGSGGECRVVAITEPRVAGELVARARARRVADLSLVLDTGLSLASPEAGPEPYRKRVLASFTTPGSPFFALTHDFDSLVGTHLLLPSHSLPARREEVEGADPAIRAAVADHEARYGPLPRDPLTTEAVDPAAAIGPVHVVDIRATRGYGGFAPGRPAGPVINRAYLEEHEASRPFLPGEVVLFRSDFTDDALRARSDPAGAAAADPLWGAPLAGDAEGWPAPTPEALAWLAVRGIRCVGTDAPSLGGVDARESHSVEWMAATLGMVVVENLVNLEAIDGRDAFFLFAPVKIAGTHGGHGRAIALVGDAIPAGAASSPDASALPSERP